MLLIRTRIGPSMIHGTGVFALQAVEVGEAVWRYDPAFDRLIGDAEVAQAPEAFRAFLDTYAYRSLDVPGGIILPCDHARFLNHSNDPNTQEHPFVSLARKPIAIGDEITCDYAAFCIGWTGFDQV
jgi:uncharacterized protein